MNINYFKTGLFVTAAIAALLSACNTTPATQPTTIATTTATNPPTSTPTPTATDSSPKIITGQREKAIESSGRLYLGSLSRAQQAYFIEKSKFSSTIDDLGVGIKAEDSNYLLQIVDTQPKSVTMTATAKQDNVKSFAASVFKVGNTGSGLTGFIVCATDAPSKTSPTGITAPKTEKDAPTCPTGSSSVEIRKPS